MLLRSLLLSLRKVLESPKGVKIPTPTYFQQHLRDQMHPGMLSFPLIPTVL